MSKRRIKFDTPKTPPPPPVAHRCHCGALACWGFREPGVAALREPTRSWYCRAHVPQARPPPA